MQVVRLDSCLLHHSNFPCITVMKQVLSFLIFLLKEQSNTVIQMVIAEIEWSVEFEVETVGFKEVKG